MKLTLKRDLPLILAVVLAVWCYMEQIGIKGYTSLLCIMFDNVLNQTFYNLFSAIESAGGYIGILMNIAYTM